jgi:hypothetical protein
MTVYPRACAFLFIFTFTTLAFAQTQFYDPQSQPKHSTMFGVGWEPITDNEFAIMARGLLVKNGNTNTRGASFLFEQCFSGGMFDELSTQLGNEVRWVGGAAARHDESSWGEGDSDSFALDYWTKSLQLAMQENDSMINTVNLARLLDEAGPTYDNKEHPQSIYRNGGQNINHRTIGASSHNAILWAGHANGERHVNDIKIMYNTIRSAYQDTGDPFTITILGDSGDLGLPAMPATKANLEAAFAAMASSMGPDADFLFFASDHGGTDTYWQSDRRTITASTIYQSQVTLSQSELDGMLRTREGVPQLVMQFEGLDKPGLRVFLDNIDLGDPYEAQGRDGTYTISITRGLLADLGPEVELRIDNRTLSDVILVDGLFRTGGIDNVIDAAVPEPSSLALLALLAPLLAARRPAPSKAARPENS